MLIIFTADVSVLNSARVCASVRRETRLCISSDMFVSIRIRVHPRPNVSSPERIMTLLSVGVIGVGVVSVGPSIASVIVCRVVAGRRGLTIATYRGVIVPSLAMMGGRRTGGSVGSDLDPRV